jgi:hypothetical protein
MLTNSLALIDVPERLHAQPPASIFLLAKLAARVPVRGASLGADVAAARSAAPATSLDAKLLSASAGMRGRVRGVEDTRVHFAELGLRETARACADDEATRAFLDAARCAAAELIQVRLQEAMALITLLAVPRNQRMHVLLMRQQ